MQSISLKECIYELLDELVLTSREVSRLIESQKFDELNRNFHIVRSRRGNRYVGNRGYEILDSSASILLSKTNLQLKLSVEHGRKSIIDAIDVQLERAKNGPFIPLTHV